MDEGELACGVEELDFGGDLSDVFARETSEFSGDHPEEFVPTVHGAEVLLKFERDGEACGAWRVGRGFLAVYEFAAVGLEFECVSGGLDADNNGNGRHGCT